MKINRETKVGLLTIVALAMLIMGFNYLKGKDILNTTKKIYAIFPKLGTLVKSNEVKINGLTIGTVYDLEEVDKNVTGIKVIISLTRDVNIPTNSVAYISASTLGLGSAAIIIEKGDATTYLKNGDVLNTRIDEGLFGGISAEVSPTLSTVRNTLDTVSKVLSNVNTIFDEGAKNSLRHTLANLALASNSLNKLLDLQSSALAASLNNVNAITGNIKNNNDSLTAIILNAKQFTENLATLELKQTMDTLQAAISQLKGTMAKISSKEGTLGALINDRQLYDRLNSAVLSAEILIDDLRTHPKRYVNVSVFGKKDKGGALTSPAKKDTVPR
jgi:phospholipid/cholesterol/gamma-HCH transport system substrate-binding protein